MSNLIVNLEAHDENDVLTSFESLLDVTSIRVLMLQYNIAPSIEITTGTSKIIINLIGINWKESEKSEKEFIKALRELINTAHAQNISSGDSCVLDISLYSDYEWVIRLKTPIKRGNKVVKNMRIWNVFDGIKLPINKGINLSSILCHWYRYPINTNVGCNYNTPITRQAPYNPIINPVYGQTAALYPNLKSGMDVTSIPEEILKECCVVSKEPKYKGKKFLCLEKLYYHPHLRCGNYTIKNMNDILSVPEMRKKGFEPIYRDGYSVPDWTKVERWMLIEKPKKEKKK